MARYVKPVSKFRKNNYTKEEKLLLAKSIHADDEFLFEKYIKGAVIQKMATKKSTARFIRICEAIRSYQIRKLKLQQELFKFDIESLPSELLAFLLDEDSMRYQIIPVDRYENPQDDMESLIAKQQQLHSLLRMDILTKKLGNFFKAQKRVTMMEQMKGNKLQWDDTNQAALNTEYKLLNAIVRSPYDRRYELEEQILINLKKIDKTTTDTNKKVTKILATVQEMDETMKKGFQQVLTRIDKLEKDLLKAINANSKGHILDDLILTEADDKGIWRYGIADMKPFTFSGDSDGELDVWNWSEFQSPMVAWNVFFRVAFYNSYRAIKALVTTLMGGESDFTVEQYFKEFGQAIAVWISAVAKLIYSAIKNITLMSFSVLNLDVKSFYKHGAKLVCSIVMATVGEMMVAAVSHGAMGSALSAFGSNLGYLVKGVQRHAFRSIISICVSFLDSIWYTITGFTVVGGGSYDSILYTRLRLGIDSMANALYNFMPKYPGSNLTFSVRDGINRVGKLLIQLFQYIYTTYIKWLGTPEPVKAVQAALKEVAVNPQANVEKVIETATCASDNAIKDNLDNLKQYFVDQQAWGDWFMKRKIELPADLERYRKWMKLEITFHPSNSPKYVMAVVTHDGKTLLMLKEHAEMCKTSKQYKLLKF
jgi:hypothetical protein